MANWNRRKERERRFEQGNEYALTYIVYAVSYPCACNFLTIVSHRKTQSRLGAGNRLGYGIAFTHSRLIYSHLRRGSCYIDNHRLLTRCVDKPGSRPFHPIYHALPAFTLDYWQGIHGTLSKHTDESRHLPSTFNSRFQTPVSLSISWISPDCSQV